MRSKTFPNLKKLAQHIREILSDKKCYLLFAYNGTGKTRLSGAFKELGKKKISGSEEKMRDTLYYNAFTEDLFTWDNDIEGDTDRRLLFNKYSRFFDGLRELEMETRIRPFLRVYADFDFTFNYDDGYVRFSREVMKGESTEKINGIKVSRGEENIFIWCFFLAIVQLVADHDTSYDWVKYVYIDDPISSLDDNNLVATACQLTQLLKDSDIKTVISTHHVLFFNVLHNELKKNYTESRYLSVNKETGKYITRNTGDTPFFHHVALLKELKKASETGKLYTYHFNILRNILEKTASFHGFKNFSDCIKRDEGDIDDTIYTRMTNLLSHGNHSLFEPVEMVEDNKKIFTEILDGFMENYKFNPELFGED